MKIVKIIGVVFLGTVVSFLQGEELDQGEKKTSLYTNPYFQKSLKLLEKSNQQQNDMLNGLSGAPFQGLFSDFQEIDNRNDFKQQADACRQMLKLTQGSIKQGVANLSKDMRSFEEMGG